MSFKSLVKVELEHHLAPIPLLATVNADRDRVLVGPDHPLHVVLFEGGCEFGKRVGPILSEEFQTVVADTESSFR